MSELGKDHERPFIRITMYSLKKTEDGVFYLGEIPVELLNTLVRGLKVDHEVVLPYDNKWGARLPNGTWNGMVGMVNRSEVEFALGLFSLTPERNAAVSYTQPFLFDNNRLVTPRPTLENDVTGFMKPFTYQVWLLILASLIVITLATYFIVKLEGKFFKRFTDNIFSKSVMWACKTLTQEGSEWVPEKDAGRVIVITWLLASLVFMTSYSGILTAMLTLPRVNIPIDSLADLVAQDEVPWHLTTSSFVTNFLKRSPDPVHQKAYTGSSGFITGSCSASRETIVLGKYATICYEISLRKFIWNHFKATGKCTLYIAREKVYSDDMMAVIFKPNSEYYDKANRIISSLTETGIMDKWYRKSIPSANECFRPPSFDRGDGIAALNIEALGGIFIVLAGGLFLAFLTFLVELLTRIWFT